jgi:hypothetical protein
MLMPWSQSNPRFWSRENTDLCASPISCNAFILLLSWFCCLQVQQVGQGRRQRADEGPSLLGRPSKRPRPTCSSSCPHGQQPGAPPPPGVSICDASFAAAFRSELGDNSLPCPRLAHSTGSSNGLQCQPFPEIRLGPSTTHVLWQAPQGGAEPLPSPPPPQWAQVLAECRPERATKAMLPLISGQDGGIAKPSLLVCVQARESKKILYLGVG